MATGYRATLTSAALWTLYGRPMTADVPRVLQQRIADASPHGTLAVIEGAGHFPFAETPERYWPVVARWLEETAPQQ